MQHDGAALQHDPAAPEHVVFYASGHGFGHYVRVLAIAEALVRSRPQVRAHLRTDSRALSIAPRDAVWASRTEVDTGPGVVQRGPLSVDLDSTRERLAEHLRRFDSLVDEEASAVHRLGARLAIADGPPLAFAACARAGVPAIGIGNFTWSWIYGGYEGPVFAEAAANLRGAEALATSFLALIMLGRWTDANQLGAYAVAVSVLAVLLAAQESLITRPCRASVTSSRRQASRRCWVSGPARCGRSMRISSWQPS